jgi:hypothetical protein
MDSPNDGDADHKHHRPYNPKPEKPAPPIHLLRPFTELSPKATMISAMQVLPRHSNDRDVVMLTATATANANAIPDSAYQTE